MALQSHGIAPPTDLAALQDLRWCHPLSPLPTHTSTCPAPLSTSTTVVQGCLLSFPKDLSPGSSGLRIQHLMDTISDTIVPSSQDCLEALIQWINHLLSGKGHPLLAPWLCGAPLTALHKKNHTGFRPIVVGEIYHQLVSRISWHHVRPDLPKFFTPYGQLGVGIKGGLEAAIHSTRFLIDRHQNSPDMCLLKLDFRNAFNEVCRRTILNQVQAQFPELFGWVQWSYSCASELRFGPHHILSTIGVQ